MLLALSMMCLGISRCKDEQGRSFNPDFYFGNSARESVINEDNVEVKCSDPAIQRMGWMTESKILELVEVSNMNSVGCT